MPHVGSDSGTVEDALKFIHSLYRFGSRPGLDRIRRLLDLGGNPHRGIPVIHVGGTNGKGSVAAMVASVVQAAGYRTGLFVSPYICDFGERIMVDGRHFTGEDLVAGVDWISPLIDQIVAAGDEHPTEFEVVTALGFWQFRRRAVDVAVVEVGLGGRLDSTNIVAADDVRASVITSIGYDHVEQLGPTLADIAAEKAGIIKAGTTVISGVTGGAPAQVIERRCHELGARLWVLDRDFAARSLSHGLLGHALVYQDRFGEIDGIAIPLAGRHQVDNAAIAMAVTRELVAIGYSIDHQTLVRGMETVAWPGRFEVLSVEPTIVVDAAHNREGVEHLVASIRELIGRPVTLITGMLSDKPVADMVRELAGVAGHVVVTEPPGSRAVDRRVLARMFEGHGLEVTVAETIPAAVSAALARSGGGPVVCAGSCYLAGPVRTDVLNRLGR